MNLNDTISFRPNDITRELVPDLDVDDDGLCHMQLWVFCQTFGPHLAMWKPVVTEDNSITTEAETENETLKKQVDIQATLVASTRELKRAVDDSVERAYEMAATQYTAEGKKRIDALEAKSGQLRETLRKTQERVTEEALRSSRWNLTMENKLHTDALYEIAQVTIEQALLKA